MCDAVLWVLPQRTKETKKHTKEIQKRKHSSGQNVNTDASQKSESTNQ